MSYLNNPPNINETFIIEEMEFFPTITACTGVYTNEIIGCDSDATISLGPNDIVINKNILPNVDATIVAGSPTFRFREINTISGSSTTWSSSQKITTPILDLGLDSELNNRTITANNSIIQNDIINLGEY